jgi:hypothetical protein
MIVLYLRLAKKKAFVPIAIYPKRNAMAIANDSEKKLRN